MFDAGCCCLRSSLEQNPEPSLAACVRAERYRMLETPLHFSVSRDRAIAMVREEWPEFTEEQFDDLIDRKRIDWRLIDGELFVLDNFLDSLRVYPKEVPGLRPDPTDSIALRNQMLEEMETQGGLSRAITLKASMSVPGALEERPSARGYPLPPPVVNSLISRFSI